MINPLTDMSRWMLIGRPTDIRELRHRAGMELAANQSITVYGFLDGVEVNRRRPRWGDQWDRLRASMESARVAFQDRLFPVIADAGEAFRKFAETFEKRKP